MVIKYRYYSVTRNVVDTPTQRLKIRKEIQNSHACVFYNMYKLEINATRRFLT